MIPLEFEEDTNEFDSNGTFREVKVVLDWEGDYSHARDLPRGEEALEVACEDISNDKTSSVEKSAPSPPSIGKETPPPVERERRFKRKRQLLNESEDYKLSIKKIAEERSAVLIKLQEEEHLSKIRNLEQENEVRMKEHQMQMNVEEEREQKQKEHSLKMEIFLLKKRVLLKICKFIMLKEITNRPK
ncbi:uncharacterized protein [Anabrus simplex]|uniref:uncharacterized protein n=1 Tax=Anabrus simplex TaxID=316456 RepID=UPI0035A2634D